MDKTREIHDSALSYIALWPFLVCRLGTICICNVCRGYWRRPFRKNTPRPPNGVRERALTAPLPDHEEVITSGDVLASMRRAGLKIQRKTHRAQRTFDQAQSPLFTRLPAEIRRLIYIELFAGDVPIVHIVRKNRQLTHLRCISNCTTHLTSLTVYGWNNWGCPTGDLIPRHTAPRTDGGIIPLLLACRKIYSESIDLLYSSTTFSFSTNDALIHLSLSILPQRLNAIRTLHLRWLVPFKNPSFRLDFQAWDKVCDVMALMQGLQILRIGVDVRPLAERIERSFEIWERHLLEPLRKVTMVRNFEVTLWRVPLWTKRYEMMDGAPFRLIDGIHEPYKPAGTEICCTQDEEVMFYSPWLGSHLCVKTASGQWLKPTE